MVQEAMCGHWCGPRRWQQEQGRGHPCKAVGVVAEQQLLQLGGAQGCTRVAWRDPGVA